MTALDFWDECGAVLSAWGPPEVLADLLRKHFGEAQARPLGVDQVRYILIRQRRAPE